MTPQQIKSLREHLGQTQEQFAANFGVDRTTVAHWERDNGHPPSGPSMILLERLRDREFRKRSRP